jgi:hypothetical protein
MRKAKTMADDCYEKGKELSKEGIYQILAEETWRDGELGSADSELLEGLRKYLRLQNGTAMRLLDLAEEKYRSSSLGRLRDFSPNQCYSRALRYAYSDAEELSSREEKYLRGLRAALGLTEQDHQTILEKLESKGWGRGPGGRAIDIGNSASPQDQLRRPFTDQQPDVIAEGGLELRSPEPTISVSPLPEPSPDPPATPAEEPLPESPVAEEVLEAAIPEAVTPEVEKPEKKVSPVSDPGRSQKLSSSQKMRRSQKRRRSQSQKMRRGKPPSQAEPLPSRPNPFENLPPVVRLILLVGVFMGVLIVILPLFMGEPGEDPDGLGNQGEVSAGKYEALEEQYGKALFKVKQLVVRGPDPPNGPPLDLGEAWDFSAGRDGKLYGTAQYRIFQIDPKTGRARWVAGNGKIGEPSEGKKALESELDPASPRVDSNGTLFFRQGSSGIFRVERDGTLARVLGTRDGRVVWKDGDQAREAKPGAIEQIALGSGGRLYFDEYSGEAKGPEILGRIEPGEKLRAMFLFALEPIDHPYGRLVKSFIGTGNGFENLEVGEDGGIYFAVGGRLYRWISGGGPPTLLLPEAPLDFAVDREGSLIVVKESHIERWRNISKWTQKEKFIDLVAGGAEEVIPSGEHNGVLPGTAAGYVQPRDLTIGPDGTLYVLDGAAGGSGLSRPRIDMIKLAKKK